MVGSGEPRQWTLAGFKRFIKEVKRMIESSGHSYFKVSNNDRDLEDGTIGARRKSKSNVYLSCGLLLLAGILIGRWSKSDVSHSALWQAEVWPTANETLRLLESTEALPGSIANNARLSHDACNAGFPLLWHELTKTSNHYESKGISLKDIESVEVNDGTRVAIINNQLYIKRFHGEWTKRSEAVLASLYLAVKTAPEPITDVELWFRATDNVPMGAHWGLNREPGETLWLLPDFGFWSWPEPGVKGWANYRDVVMKMDTPQFRSQKKDKLFWRGARLAPIRDRLFDVTQKYGWSDVGEIKWGEATTGRIEMPDHCQYHYLASVEGNSAYSGRLKYLLMCKSVVISHRMRWTQHFHNALNSMDGSPDQNFVELKGQDWDGLASTMENLLKDKYKTELISNNAARVLRDRYLTPAAVACYWRRALAEYSKHQRFTPVVGDGTDYESWMLMGGAVHWDPHR